MRNITELRENLADNYDQLKSGKMEPKLAKELANTAGKILTSIKTELEYNRMVGRKKKIDFMQ